MGKKRDHQSDEDDNNSSDHERRTKKSRSDSHRRERDYDYDGRESSSKRDDKEKEREKEKDKDKEKEKERESRKKYSDDKQQQQHRDENQEDPKKSQAEISLSTDEWNKIREKLGLAPLKDQNSSEEKARRAEEEEKRKADSERERRAAEVEERIEKSKKKRMLNQKLAGKGLGDSDDDEVDNVESWVEKSRKLELQKKQAKKLASKFDQEEEEQQQPQGQKKQQQSSIPEPKYTSQDLKGLKIDHQVAEFKEGTEIILTLKDRNVLDDEDEIGQDELENINLAEEARRLNAIEKSKSKTAVDLLEMGEGTGDVLTKYDDEKKKEGLILDEKGTFDSEKQQRIEAIRQKLQQKNAKVETLEVEKNLQVSDYYTNEEMVKFKKLRKKKKTQKNSKIEQLLMAEAGEANSYADHGSRRQRGQDNRDLENAIENDERYERALLKANIESQKLRQSEPSGNSSTAMEIDSSRNDGWQTVEEIQRQEAREGIVGENGKNKRKNKNENNEENDHHFQDEKTKRKVLVGLGEGDDIGFEEEEKFDKYTSFPAVLKGGVNDGNDVLKLLEDAIKTEKKETDQDQSNRIILSETYEFCRAIQATSRTENKKKTEPLNKPKSTNQTQQQEQTKSEEPEVEIKKANEENMMDIDENEEKESKNNDNKKKSKLPSSFTAVSQSSSSTENEEKKKSKKSKSSEETVTSVLADEPVIQTGIAAALAYAKNKNFLVEEKTAGRNNDPRHEILGKVEEEEEVDNDVRLTYKDEFGREMTKKEAFRHLSHKFHGRGPGKKKQEQRLLKYYQELEENRQQADPANNSKFLQALQAHQKRTGQAFVVVQGTQKFSSGDTVSKIKAKP